ncbi:hypothetical protein JZO77_05010 [Enterococcus hulanensis]|uniref:Phenylalanyl-tRNA synthetase subunit alpha n=1 Tax=Enterococcus hulanensis TaxID=2559929 RepID=A0ABU3F025_9ENTE|nr:MULTISPECIES: hypothetical protein [Enterococcus]MBO0411732.1 hypothetical protein [Enterococcus hulanensis]MBO0456097.1 hypothetical protein [Enterococcus hulanensis]MBX8936409.1 hypothetical protein [Enterococcus gilvus]MDT2600488.1 hypothetical protein [Enterococcus hulanensis]MDT2609774.1 hypothetical protein [Enterococcus hulanensis]
MEKQKYTKTVYFVEETHNIEGAYVEVNTLFVADDQEKATEVYEQLIKEQPKKSFGLLLNEYIINADGGFFHNLLQSWKNLPAEFYRKMQILTYRPLAEYQN